MKIIMINEMKEIMKWKWKWNNNEKRNEKKWK